MEIITELVEATETIRNIKKNKDTSIWKGSKFEHFKNLASRSLGAKGEQIIEEVMKTMGHNASKKRREGDRVIDDYEVEIKTSTCWNEELDKFTWQQIRKQDYDRIIFLGVNPNEAKMWWATKVDLENHIFDRDKYRQHAGKKGGQDLYWLQGCSKQNWFRDIETF